jgi:hypothetical protein
LLLLRARREMWLRHSFKYVVPFLFRQQRSAPRGRATQKARLLQLQRTQKA